MQINSPRKEQNKTSLLLQKGWLYLSLLQHLLHLQQMLLHLNQITRCHRIRYLALVADISNRSATSTQRVEHALAY